MTLNSNSMKNPPYSKSGQGSAVGKRAFSFRSGNIYGLRERSINRPEAGPPTPMRPLFVINSSRQTMAFEETF